VLKIEGRARRPYYAYAITNEYRKAIDGGKYSKKEIELAFNRGFCSAYLDGNGDIISRFQSHTGVSVGQIIRINGGKNFNEVFFSSSEKLSPKSTFKIFSGGEMKGALTAYDLKEVSNGVYRLTTTQNLKVGDRISLITDYLREESVKNLSPKKEIKLKIKIKQNQNIELSALVIGKQIVVKGDVLTPAKNQPLTKEEITANFSKSEYFIPIVEFSAFEPCFVSKKQLNEFRRKCYQEIFSAYAGKREVSRAVIDFSAVPEIDFLSDFQFVEKADDKFFAKTVIYSPENYQREDVSRFIDNCKRGGARPYIDAPNFATSEDIGYFKSIIDGQDIGVVANNYYALGLKNDTIVGAGLNVYNKITANCYGGKILTAEKTGEGKIKFPYMTLKACPMKNHLGASCKNCPFTEGFTLECENGKVMKIKRKKLKNCTFYLVD